jgi:hypothetical protein
MKKLIFVSLIFASFSAYAYKFPTDSYYIQKEVNKNSTAVPDAVLANFNSMFPDAKSVRWRLLESSYHPDNNQYIAFFRLDNIKRTARFAPDGTYLGGS